MLIKSKRFSGNLSAKKREATSTPNKERPNCTAISLIKMTLDTSTKTESYNKKILSSNKMILGLSTVIVTGM